MIRKAMRFKGVGIDEISRLLGTPVLTTVSKLYGEQRFSLEEAFVVRERYFSEYSISELFSERGDADTQRFVAEYRRKPFSTDNCEAGTSDPEDAKRDRKG